MLRVAGVALFVFLFVALRGGMLGQGVGLLVLGALLHGVGLIAWFLLLGVALSQLLSLAKAHGSRWVAGGWAAHLGGLMLGYALNHYLVMNVGAHAVLVVIGLSLLLLPRFAVLVLAAGLTLAPLTGLDGAVEGWRDTSLLPHERAYGYTKVLRAHEGSSAGEEFRPFTSYYDVIHHSWSPFNHFQLVRRPGASRSPKFVGMYNFTHQWNIKSFVPPESLGLLRSAMYSLIEEDMRVLIVGTGGGRGLYAIPVALHKGIKAVERDPAVVRLFRDLDPSLNGGVYTEVDAIAADGRFAIETRAEPLDMLILESARFQPMLALCSAASPYYLYTREAIAHYMDKLEPDGLLLANFNRIWSGAKDNFLPLHFRRSLDAAGVPHRTFCQVSTSATGKQEAFVYLVASRSEQRLEQALAQAQAWGMAHGSEDDEATRLRTDWRPFLRKRFGDLERSELTDDRPFLGWSWLSPGGRIAVQSIAIGIVLGVGLSLLALLRAVRRRPGWNPVPFFVLIGIGHTAVQMASFYGYRSFFGDEILTMTRLMIYFLAYGALGSALAGMLGARRLPTWLRVTVTLGALGLHLLLMAYLPFQNPSELQRELFGALAMLPGGVLLGLFFPLGLVRAQQDLVPHCLLGDALGVLATYALFFMVFLPFGRGAFLAAACLAYLLAATVAWPRATGGGS